MLQITRKPKSGFLLNERLSLVLPKGLLRGKKTGLDERLVYMLFGCFSFWKRRWQYSKNKLGSKLCLQLVPLPCFYTLISRGTGSGGALSQRTEEMICNEQGISTTWKSQKHLEKKLCGLFSLTILDSDLILSHIHPCGIARHSAKRKQNLRIHRNWVWQWKQLVVRVCLRSSLIIILSYFCICTFSF